MRKQLISSLIKNNYFCRSHQIYIFLCVFSLGLFVCLACHSDPLTFSGASKTQRKWDVWSSSQITCSFVFTEAYVCSTSGASMPPLIFQAHSKHASWCDSTATKRLAKCPAIKHNNTLSWFSPRAANKERAYVDCRDSKKEREREEGSVSEDASGLLRVFALILSFTKQITPLPKTNWTPTC